MVRTARMATIEKLEAGGGADGDFRLFPLCFGVIALGIHSKRPDMINFALHYGPELFGSQSRYPLLGPGLLVSGQHPAGDGFLLEHPPGHSRSKPVRS